MTVLARRLVFMAGLLAAMGASAAYGYLIRPWRLFPYSIIFREHRGAGHRATSLPRDGGPPRTELVEGETEEGAVQTRTEMSALNRSGVVTYDPARAEDGLNFFTSAHAPLATLIDMKGAIVRTWSADAGKIFPAKAGSSRAESDGRFIRDAELLPDGGILALFDEVGIVRLDARSGVVWSFPGRMHHDLYLDATGMIWALSHEERLVPEFRRDPILDGVILSLSPDGRLLRRISVLDCFRRSSYAPVLTGPKGSYEDPFQIHSVIVLDGTLADRSPAFRRGNLLISSPNLGMIAVLDPDRSTIVWALSGLWQGPESARLLSVGHLLLFDGFGPAQKAPRVLEVDPFSQELVWSLGTSPGSALLSETGGSVERLPGGNTLITETGAGHVREVTPDHRIVWEFVNPNRVGQKQKFVADIYCMERVPLTLPFLSGAAGSSPSPSGSAAPGLPRPLRKER